MKLLLAEAEEGVGAGGVGGDGPAVVNEGGGAGDFGPVRGGAGGGGFEEEVGIGSGPGEGGSLKGNGEFEGLGDVPGGDIGGWFIACGFKETCDEQFAVGASEVTDPGCVVQGINAAADGVPIVTVPPSDVICGDAADFMEGSTGIEIAAVGGEGVEGAAIINTATRSGPGSSIPYGNVGVVRAESDAAADVEITTEQSE